MRACETEDVCVCERERERVWVLFCETERERVGERIWVPSHCFFRVGFRVYVRCWPVLNLDVPACVLPENADVQGDLAQKNPPSLLESP